MLTSSPRRKHQELTTINVVALLYGGANNGQICSVTTITPALESCDTLHANNIIIVTINIIVHINAITVEYLNDTLPGLFNDLRIYVST